MPESSHAVNKRKEKRQPTRKEQRKREVHQLEEQQASADQTKKHEKRLRLNFLTTLAISPSIFQDEVADSKRKACHLVDIANASSFLFAEQVRSW